MSDQVDAVSAARAALYELYMEMPKRVGEVFIALAKASQRDVYTSAGTIAASICMDFASANKILALALTLNMVSACTEHDGDGFCPPTAKWKEYLMRSDDREAIMWNGVHGWIVGHLGSQIDMVRRPTLRVGFDIGGVLSKFSEARRLFEVLHASPEAETYVLTDMPLDKAKAMLDLNGIELPPGRLHSCNYDEHGEGCKAVKSEALGLHILIDDFIGYVAVQRAPFMRLLAMPDATRKYYSDDWKTDGSEGAFGRVRFTP